MCPYVLTLRAGCCSPRHRQVRRLFRGPAVTHNPQLSSHLPRGTQTSGRILPQLLSKQPHHTVLPAKAHFSAPLMEV